MRFQSPTKSKTSDMLDSDVLRPDALLRCLASNANVLHVKTD